MESLTSEVAHFLDAVALVSELDQRDLALKEEEDALSARLGHAESPRCEKAAELIVQKLQYIRWLRRDIGNEIALIRAQESLQVLGSESAGLPARQCRVRSHRATMSSGAFGRAALRMIKRVIRAYATYFMTRR